MLESVILKWWREPPAFCSAIVFVFFKAKKVRCGYVDNVGVFLILFIFGWYLARWWR